MPSIPKKILVIQLRRIGDVVLTTPVAQVLAETFPKAQIDFLVERPCDEALQGNPYISNIRIYDRKSPLKGILQVRGEKYDWVIDLMTNPRTRYITLFSGAAVKAGPAFSTAQWAYNVHLPLQSDDIYTAFKKIKMLAPLGIPQDKFPLPLMKLQPCAEEFRAKAFASLGLTKEDLIIGLAPASRRITRQWPPEHYAALAKRIAVELNAKPLIFWGPGELELAQEIAKRSDGAALVSPPTKNIQELAALIAGTRLLVCNFNGPKHVATATGIPTLGIYGMCNPKSWTPQDNPLHQTIGRDDLPCISCGRLECPRGLECLKGLPVEKVFARLKAMLGL